jgi:hypothetical protein
MTTILSRLYADREQADSVAADLKAEGYGARDMDVIAASEGASHDAVRQDISKAGVAATAAGIYAGRVAGGNALVVVRAPFGKAQKAGNIMDAHGPMDAGVKTENAYDPGQDPQMYNMRGGAPVELLPAGTFFMGFSDDGPLMRSGPVLPGPHVSSKPSGTKLMSGTLFTSFMPMLKRGHIMTKAYSR